MSGKNAFSKAGCSHAARDTIQQAGPKLSGYPTSTATRATVIQKPAVGCLRSVIAAIVSGGDVPDRRILADALVATKPSQARGCGAVSVDCQTGYSGIIASWRSI